MPKATLQAAPEQAEPPVNAAGVAARPGAMPDAPARHSRASMGLVPVRCERGLLLPLEWEWMRRRSALWPMRNARSVEYFVHYVRKCESAPQPSWLTLSLEQPRLNPVSRRLNPVAAELELSPQRRAPRNRGVEPLPVRRDRRGVARAETRRRRLRRWSLRPKSRASSLATAVLATAALATALLPPTTLTATTLATVAALVAPAVAIAVAAPAATTPSPSPGALAVLTCRRCPTARLPESPLALPELPPPEVSAVHAASAVRTATAVFTLPVPVAVRVTRVSRVFCLYVRVSSREL